MTDNTQQKSPYYYNKVALAIVKNSQGEVLIVRKKYDIEYITGGHLNWSFPGGCITEEYKPSECAERHALEQTGYRVYAKDEISQRMLHPLKNHITYIECELIDSPPVDIVSDSTEIIEWVDPQNLNQFFTSSLDVGVASFLGL
jgi:8-oxo-dGTP pyrophosphatase MutT (NUDIX family)